MMLAILLPLVLTFIFTNHIPPDLSCIAFRHPRNHILMIAIMTHKKSLRLDMLMNFYGNDLIETSGVKFTFVNAPPNTAYPNIPMNEKYFLITKKTKGAHPQSKEIFSAFFSGIDDFMKTDYKWYYRGTDDTVINSMRMPAFLRYLENMPFDPLKVPKIYGNCVYHKNKPFLHGGSGFIFSRAAIEMIYEGRYKFLNNLSHADDVENNVFLNLINETLYEASSPFFAGYGLRGHRHNASKCWKVKERECRSIIGTPGDIIFAHFVANRRNFTKSYEKAQYIFNTSSAFGIMHYAYTPTLCKPDSRVVPDGFHNFS